MEANQNAETETYKNKTKEIEDLWNPIMTKFYGAGGAPGGMPGGFPGGAGGFPGGFPGGAGGFPGGPNGAGPGVDEVD